MHNNLHLSHSKLSTPFLHIHKAIMGSFGQKLHIFLFPFLAHGHMIPVMDMAKLFSSKGLKTTIITTPLNAPFFTKIIQRNENFILNIDVKILKFPSSEAGLPDGCENLDAITSDEKADDFITKFMMATASFQSPLEKLLQEFHPDCIVADMFFPWATDSASKFGIPRLVFHGTSLFALCAQECIRLYQPHKNVSSDSEPFVIPNLPGDIKLTKKQLSEFSRHDVENDLTKLMIASKESELKSFGVVVNSFYELEPKYADHYRNVLGRQAWNIGPLLLWNREGIEDKAQRGKEASDNEHECLKWLDSKKPNSVIYICFGSISLFLSSQLKEIALGLESSGQQFMWVVRGDDNKSTNKEDEEDWLPEGFDKRMEGKGPIIRGWAPQVLILEHEAIGGFVTHCGWNSTLEGITAGKPMVTWPIAAEQFYNENLVTDVLKIGAGVGVKEWVRLHGDFVKSDAIDKAIRRIMVGEEAEKMRNRVKTLAEMARKAVEDGGSSSSDLNALVQALKSHNSITKQE